MMNKAIGLRPTTYALAYYNRVIVQAQLGCVDKAIENYSEAVRIDENYSKAYNNRAYAL
jgi:tetratricopeptide (TPR) repeat protein